MSEWDPWIVYMNSLGLSRWAIYGLENLKTPCVKSDGIDEPDISQLVELYDSQAADYFVKKDDAENVPDDQRRPRYNKKKYIVQTVDADSVRLQKGPECVVMVKTKKYYLIGMTDDGEKLASCYDRLCKAKTYLESVGY